MFSSLFISNYNPAYYANIDFCAFWYMAITFLNGSCTHVFSVSLTTSVDVLMYFLHYSYHYLAFRRPMAPLPDPLWSLITP